MKIAYITNYLNHHTRYWAEAMYKLLGDDFYFLETQNPNADQSDSKKYQLGIAYYFAEEKSEEVLPWRIRAYQPENRIVSQEIIDNADVVITANSSDLWIRQRLKRKKLTFRAHERWYKKGLPAKRRMRAKVGGWLHHGRFSSLYMLCASAYTPWDTHQVNCFRGKCYRWGYFPQEESLSEEILFRRKENDIPVILWAGRMIDWKHAEDAVEACGRLRKLGYRFRLRIAGDGELQGTIRSLTLNLGLDDCTEFLGMVTPETTRALMECANIFLVTSDIQEGWGVVVNEAMSCGCGVVASHAAGAVPYLITHDVNGLIYPSGNVDQLAEQIRRYLDDLSFCEQCGRKAYRMIRESWSPSVAAERLYQLCDYLLDGKTGSPFASGVCSVAPVLPNDWIIKKGKEEE